MRILKKTISVFLLILSYGIDVYGQTAEVTGVVIDQTQLPLIGASIALLNPADSTLITGVSADSTGAFKLEKLILGNYLVKVSFVGYDDFYRQISLYGKSVALNDIVLKEKTQKLGEVLVEGNISPVRQSGDTTLYNANAFKTNPDANAEELITKMPGVVMQDGKVQAQGEEVKTVLVDGKPFFGDDPNAVLKNIPAEVIDKIQVFDRKSDQSLFTGFDDGNSSKTINIITKTQFRNGTFGKLFAGYGDNNRYKAGATVNFFNNKRKITLLAQSNNINEQNFSMEDLAGVVSSPGNANRPGGQQGGHGGGNRGPMGSGSSGRSYGGQGNETANFLINQNTGINTTNAIGLNYINQWKKIDFTGSYFLNSTQNESTSETYRKYSLTVNEGLSYIEKKIVRNNNINHRINLKVEYKIDSIRSIFVQPKFSAQINNGNTGIAGQSSLPVIELLNAQSSSVSRLTVLNYALPVLFKNAFRKKGRTFSLNITPGYNIYNGENFLVSSGINFIDSLNIDSLDQFAELVKNGITVNSNLTYTEPISEQFLLNLNYITNYNQQESIKETYERDEISAIFNTPDVFLTNTFKYAYLAQSFGAGVRYQHSKTNFSIGIAFQQATSKNHQVVPTDFQQTNVYYKWLPNAMLMIKISEKKNLRINYRTSANPPGIEQLQNVINNTNPLQLTIGNPNLKEDWQHNLNFRYSSVNTVKNNSLFFILALSYTQDYIGTSTLLAIKKGTVINGYAVQEGSQISQPANFHEAYNLRSFFNFSSVINVLKSNLNLNAGINYGVTPGSTNEQVSFTKNISPNLGLSLTSNISRIIDFTVSSNTSVSQTVNSIQTNLNTNFLNQATKLKLNILPWKWLVVQSDLTYQYYTGLSENYNEKYILWNAGIGYKFLKNQVAELRISVYDILDQNKNITRNTTESYFEDIKTNVLQRYFMMTFTYNLKFYKDSGDDNIKKSLNK